MVEGKLSEEREPRNVQVDVVEGEGSPTIRLRDAGGVFLELPPVELDPSHVATEASDAGGATGGGDLPGVRGASRSNSGTGMRARDRACSGG